MKAENLKFQYNKQFGLKSGMIITMKSLVTIKGEKFVECHEDEIRYKPEELIEIH